MISTSNCCSAISEESDKLHFLCLCVSSVMATLQLPANNLANLANLPPGTKLYLTTNSKNPSGKGKLLLIPQGAILRASSAGQTFYILHKIYTLTIINLGVYTMSHYFNSCYSCTCHKYQRALFISFDEKNILSTTKLNILACFHGCQYEINRLITITN